VKSRDFTEVLVLSYDTFAELAEENYPEAYVSLYAFLSLSIEKDSCHQGRHRERRLQIPETAMLRVREQRSHIGGMPGIQVFRLRREHQGILREDQAIE